MTVNSSALQAVEWCNPSTSCYGICRSIAIIASGDGRQRSKVCVSDIGRFCHCLRWLGHVARMDSSRLPKQVLFGELPSRCPSHGPRKRWRDVARSDLAVAGIPESDWYDVAQGRGEWRKLVVSSSSARASEEFSVHVWTNISPGG